MGIALGAPSHAKVLDICLCTKVPIPGIYRGLPVFIAYYSLTKTIIYRWTIVVWR